MSFDAAEQGMLFDVPTYPIHLRPSTTGYALLVATPNDKPVDLFEGEAVGWPSALERFLAEQQRTGLQGAITSASDAELTAVSTYTSCAYPHLDIETSDSFIELSRDTRQASLFPDLIPSSYQLILTIPEGSIDLLVERNRYSRHHARECMRTARRATGLPVYDLTENGS